MKKPNFFIIGAPKCGTTALASYLASHPNIFITNPKEPHHYNSDLKHGSFKDRGKYLSLFEQAEARQTVIGEASVWYLYSTEAVLNILKDAPDAKFIVMLRNPITMAPSLHEQMVFSGYETEKDFEKAWKLQSIRRNGKKIPFWCDEPKLLLYKDACSLGSQYERVSNIIPDSNLLPIILDDLQQEARSVWTKVLRFLNVPDDGRIDFPVVNPAKVRRSAFIKTVNDGYCKVRNALGLKGLNTGFFSWLDKWNHKSRPRPSLSPEMTNALKLEFSEEIELLEKKLERDLSKWRS